MKEGYSKLLREGQKVQINLSNGEIYILEIREINEDEGLVIISEDGTNYSVNENSTEKSI